jgi:5'-3' exonuclease
MGIQGLWQFCDKRTPQVITYVPLSALHTAAVDSNFFLCQRFYTLDDPSDPNTLDQWTHLVLEAQQRFPTLRLIWLFDGDAPRTKWRTCQERQRIRDGLQQRARDEMEEVAECAEVVEQLEQQKRQRIEELGSDRHEEIQRLQATLDDAQMDRVQTTQRQFKHDRQSRKPSRRLFQELQTILRSQGVECMQCPGESDEQMAGMARAGEVDVVFTGDGDALVGMVPRVCRTLDVWTPENVMNSEGTTGCTATEAPPPPMLRIYESPRILEALHWTHGQFVDFCLLLGHDSDGMKLAGVGAVGAEELITTFRSIEGILAALTARGFKRKVTESVDPTAQTQVATVLAGDSPVVVEGVVATVDPVAPPKKKRKKPSSKLEGVMDRVTDAPPQEEYVEYLRDMRRVFMEPQFEALHNDNTTNEAGEMTGDEMTGSRPVNPT